MFGNSSLPNIVPSHLFLSPPPSPTAAAAIAPRQRPHGPREGALIVNYDVYQLRHVPAHHPRHVTAYRPSPRTIRATSPPIDRPRVRRLFIPAPPLIEGCGRMISPTSPTAARATSLDEPPAIDRHVTHRHVTHRQRRCPCHVIQQNRPPSHATSLERHVTKAEGARRMETQVGTGTEERERRKGQPRVGKRAFMPLLSRGVIPEASEAVCIPHTVSFGFPDASEVVCSPRTISFGLPGANERCAPHTPLHSVFVLRRFFPVGGSVNHAAPVSFLFRTGAACMRRPHFFPFRTGAVCMPHVAPCFFPFRTEAA